MGTNLTLVDPWHYARLGLAQECLRMFAVGLTSARALFAKRRMGKSECLEKDLVPAAQAEGYRTAFLNLWDAREAPTTALVSVIGKAMAPRGVPDALLAFDHLERTPEFFRDFLNSCASRRPLAASVRALLPLFMSAISRPMPSPRYPRPAAFRAASMVASGSTSDLGASSKEMAP